MEEKWKSKHIPDMSIFGDNLETKAQIDVDFIKNRREFNQSSIKMVSNVEYIDEDLQRVGFTPQTQYKETKFYDLTTYFDKHYYIQADDYEKALIKLRTFFGLEEDDIKVCRSISAQEYAEKREKWKSINLDAQLETIFGVMEEN